MHNGFGNNGMDNGWEWIPMVAMMAVFTVGLVWLAVTLVKRTNHPATAPHVGAVGPVGTGAPTTRAPQDILAERLATGQIDPEDYQQRMRALQGPVDR